MTFEIGDLVTPRKQVNGLKEGCAYRIRDIRRGIDGAYDWDDLFLEGSENRFCEFDFKKIESDMSIGDGMRLLKEKGYTMAEILTALIELSKRNEKSTRDRDT